MSQLGNTIINGAARVNGVLTANSAVIPTITGNLNGVATVAVSLCTNTAGNASLPVYFSGGKPVATCTTLAVSVTGNAASASKLQNSRSFSITGGATASAVSFNGESNVALTVTALDPTKISAGNIGANVNLLGNAATATAATKLNTDAGSSTVPIYFSGGVPVSCSTTLAVNITGSAVYDSNGSNIANTYLPKAGGTMAIGASIKFIDSTTGNVTTASAINLGGLYWSGKTDYIQLYGELPTESDQCHLVVRLGDDNSNRISIRNASNAETAYINANGNIKIASNWTISKSGTALVFTYA